MTSGTFKRNPERLGAHPLIGNDTIQEMRKIQTDDGSVGDKVARIVQAMNGCICNLVSCGEIKVVVPLEYPDDGMIKILIDSEAYRDIVVAVNKLDCIGTALMRAKAPEGHLLWLKAIQHTIADHVFEGGVIPSCNDDSFEAAEKRLRKLAGPYPGGDESEDIEDDGDDELDGDECGEPFKPLEVPEFCKLRDDEP